MKTNAFRIDPIALKTEQQEMVRAMEYAGISRNALAKGMCVSRNLIDQLMSNATAVRLTTEHDLFLRQACSEIGQDQFVERLLSHGKYAAKLPKVQPDGSTDDELLDAVQVLGSVRTDSLKGNWFAIRHHGEAMRGVGTRLVAESLPHISNGRDMPTMARPEAESAPLFETVVG